jgi:hypothetical protein
VRPFLPRPRTCGCLNSPHLNNAIKPSWDQAGGAPDVTRAGWRRAIYVFAATPPDRCHHLSSFLPTTHPTVVTINVAIEYQVITKSGLSSVQYAA